MRETANDSFADFLAILCIGFAIGFTVVHFAIGH